MELTVKKLDAELQIVYAEVYAPDVPDTDGDYMTSDEVRKMAHKFLSNMHVNKIDRNHDHKLVEATVVESFLARKGDPDFIPDSWVVGIHVADAEVWKQVKDGELNGLSMEAAVLTEEREIEIEIPEKVVGKTEAVNDHEHTFTVKFDDEGQLIGGMTNEVEGHAHKIQRGTVTEEAKGHAHRFSFVELFGGRE